MDKDDIIRMAREVGATRDHPELLPAFWTLETTELERFASLVAAAEREACAVIAFNAKTYLEAAAAIRARGQE
jgi:hypothetical protein